MSTFAAIDFETANYNADSACAVGLVVVSDGKIAHRESHLIRPPTREFVFTYIHGLSWDDVRDAPTFREVWTGLKRHFSRVDFVAAHNASFDRRVLRACCETYNLRVPRASFVCTVALARAQWGIYPTKLPDVCRCLGIALRHHDASSDSEACARIVMAAETNDWSLD